MQTGTIRLRRGDNGGKAPVLFSPVALAAVLIIAHRDRDLVYRNWVVRLQIGLMMTQRRDKRDMPSGF